jgi:hypothetical protein
MLVFLANALYIPKTLKLQGMVIHWAKGYKFVRENYGQKGQKFIGKKGRLSVRKTCCWEGWQ